MQKIKAYIRMGVIDALEMRFQLMYWLYVNMAPLIVMSYLWFHIYAKKENIGGYTLSMMITYYLLTRLINRIISTYSEERIAKDIKDGRLNQYITRPISYIAYKFGERIGIRVINLIIVVPVYALAIWLLRDYFIFNLTIQNTAILLLNLALSLISFFLLAYIIGMMAFFMVETHALNGLKEQVVSVMSGYLFPLSLLPGTLQNIFKLLPFYYYYNFPMQVYFGQLSLTEMATGLIIQALWVIALYVMSEIMWHRGTKNYEATGI
jgi:ABC-2 type transport system permease protein